VGLGGELHVVGEDDGIDGASLLAVTTVDTLGHVNIVTGGTTSTINTRLTLNVNSIGGANGLTELTRNATLLTGSIATESVLTAETRRNRRLFEGIVKSNLGLEELLDKDGHTGG
jgi:hypothetical protein